MVGEAAAAVRIEERAARPVAGIRVAAAEAGIRYQGRPDLCLFELAPDSAVAAVFTRNRFCAAPVVLAREHLAQGQVRYLLINSGNANAGTGASGMQAAKATCDVLAVAGGCRPSQVLPFSTGVIGQDLPLAPFERALPGLLESLEGDAWGAAAKAIMTTDTRPKQCSCTVALSAGEVRVTGIAKGSGMIRPDMATMLAFVATDAQVEPKRLQEMLERAVAPSFNSITVDGDTSTNDACVLVASGASGITPKGEDRARLQQALDAVCYHLAREIVRDGEGATRLVEVRVEGAADIEQARVVAYTIAHSPLVKTALFAADPNWGRILAAVGRAGVPIDLERVRIHLDEVCIVSHGGRDPAYREQDGQRVMDRSSYQIRVELGMGEVATTVLTCDLSYDYVKINAEYRS